MPNNNQPYFAGAYNAVYKFHKKWSGTGFTDDDWHNIVEEAGALSAQMKDDKYGMDLLYSALEEMERHNGCIRSVAERPTTIFLERRLIAVYGVNDKAELVKKLSGRGD